MPCPPLIRRTTLKTRILKNHKFYMLIPKMPSEAVKAFVYLARLAHGNKLKHAKISSVTVTRYDLDRAGILLRRTP